MYDVLINWTNILRTGVEFLNLNSLMKIKFDTLKYAKNNFQLKGFFNLNCL